MSVRDAAFIILLPALLRLFVLLGLPGSGETELTPSTLAYHQALRDHFGDYLWASTNRPPLTYAINGAFVRMFDSTVLYSARIDLLFAFAADSAAAAAIYGAARGLQLARHWAVAVGMVFSFGVIPFELWRLGRHYDHHTLPLVAFFLYATVRLLARGGRADALLAGASGALLVAQSPTNLYVVPLVILAASVLGRGIPGPVVSPRVGAVIVLLVALAPPLAVGGAIVAKNVVEARLFATGNQAGSSLMIFVHDALRDPQRAAQLVDRSAVPGWFRWCYHGRVVPPGLEADPTWDILARSFGICFPLQEPGSESWPFDLSLLHQRLNNDGAADVAALVARDMSDMRERQFLFTGYSPEQSLRWTGQYGQNAFLVWRQMLFDHPLESAVAAVRIAAQYGYRGPQVPLRTLNPPAENGMRTLHVPPPAEPVLRVWALLFALVAAAGHWALVPVLALQQVRRGLRPTPLLRRALLLLAVPMLVLAGLFTLAAWDVDRYFMQSSPYALLAAGMMLNSLQSPRWLRPPGHV